MVKYEERICGNPDCKEPFTPKTWNQRGCRPICSAVINGSSCRKANWKKRKTINRWKRTKAAYKRLFLEGGGKVYSNLGRVVDVFGAPYARTQKVGGAI